MIEILKKRAFLVVIMRIKFTNRIRRLGPNFKFRLHNQMRQSLTVGFGVLERSTMKERARQILFDVLHRKHSEIEFSNRCKLTYERIVWVQRNARFMSLFKSNKKWFNTVFKDEIKLARGVKQFMLLYHCQRTKRLREDLLK